MKIPLEQSFKRGLVNSAVVLLIAGSVGLASGGDAQASLFEFGPLSDAGGTGSATIDFSINGNELTATINNTSPALLDNGNPDNSPRI